MPIDPAKLKGPEPLPRLRVSEDVSEILAFLAYCSSTSVEELLKELISEKIATEAPKIQANLGNLALGEGDDNRLRRVLDGVNRLYPDKPHLSIVQKD